MLLAPMVLFHQLRRKTTNSGLEIGILGATGVASGGWTNLRHVQGSVRALVAGDVAAKRLVVLGVAQQLARFAEVLFLPSAPFTRVIGRQGGSSGWYDIVACPWS